MQFIRLSESKKKFEADDKWLFGYGFHGACFVFVPQCSHGLVEEVLFESQRGLTREL